MDPQSEDPNPTAGARWKRAVLTAIILTLLLAMLLAAIVGYIPVGYYGPCTMISGLLGLISVAINHRCQTRHRARNSSTKAN